MMEFKTLLFGKQGPVGILTINQPETLNALNTSVLKELGQAFDKFAEDAELRVIVLTGAGRSFVAGADIAEMSGLDAEAGKIFGQLGASVFRKIELSEKIVIAAVNGYALGGGCELALACDIRMASEKAKFAQPETGLGIVPGFSGTQRLPRIIGVGKAKELIYTGRVIGGLPDRIGQFGDGTRNVAVRSCKDGGANCFPFAFGGTVCQGSHKPRDRNRYRYRYSYRKRFVWALFRYGRTEAENESFFE